MESKKGLSIFHDVFRRADKNDDNALSMEEFKSFFADGVVSSEELEGLFKAIDTDKSSNLDTGELCAHFMKTWGPFGEIFAAFEDLSASISKALFETAKSYGDSSFSEQFSTRFLMKEVLNQLRSLERPIDIAIDKIDEQTLKSRPGVHQAAFSDPKVQDVIILGKKARQLARLQSGGTQTLDAGAGASALGVQVHRLAELVETLERKVHLHVANEEWIGKSDDSMVLVVLRELEVEESQESDFRSALKKYCSETAADDDCLHLLVQNHDETSKFSLYEVWSSEDAWKSHATSRIGKAFQHACVDCLSAPETVSKLPMPASWRKTD